MKISRRDFLKWCTASATVLGVTKFELDKLESVVMAAESTPPVIWLQGSGCSGCSISLMNSIRETTVDNLLINKINMKYHHNLMTAAGDLAISAIDETVAEYNGQFILVVEGAIPTDNNGTYCILAEKNGQPWTMLDAVEELSAQAKYVIAAGTCASYGGIPKAGSNPTGAVRLYDLLDRKLQGNVINLPGCPIHPYTLTKTIIDLLLYGMPRVDKEGRPVVYFKEKVHANCPRRGTSKAKELGVEGCYNGLGCFGPNTSNDCPNRKWNNKVNWCIEAGHMCIGCATREFGNESFYKF